MTNLRSVVFCRWQKVAHPVVMAGLCITALLPGASRADEAYPDNLVFTGGVYYVDRSSTTVAFAPKGVPLSAGINVNRDLGVDESAGSFRLDGYYRFNPKHRVAAAWYRVKRTGSATAQHSFDWNGQTYEPGWTIDSELINETFKVNYLYSFYRSPQVELAVGGGLHVSKFSSGINVKAFGASLPVDSSTYTKERELKTTAPLPVLSWLLTYHFSPRWQALWTYDLFFLNVSGVSGDFSDTNLSVEFQAFRHMGVGLGYNRVSLNGEGTHEGDQYSIDTRYDAARLYLKATF